MWWVIIIIFFCGLLLSAVTFLLQYFGYCPTTPALPGAWPTQYTVRGIQTVKEEGLPADVVSRLKSYACVKDVPFKLVPLDNDQETEEDSKNEEVECLICQEEMSKERVSQLACGHIFHKSCISSWLQRKASCPCCRQNITKELIEGSAAAPSCSPDVEMGMIKQENPPAEETPSCPPIKSSEAGTILEPTALPPLSSPHHTEQYSI